MIDHVRQIARRKGRRGAGAQLAFRDRDHLDRDAGFGLERGGHFLLLCQALGLFLDGPDADIGAGHGGHADR